MNALLCAKDTVTGAYEANPASLAGLCMEELLRIKNALWLVYGSTPLEEKIVKIIEAKKVGT